MSEPTTRFVGLDVHKDSIAPNETLAEMPLFGGSHDRLYRKRHDARSRQVDHFFSPLFSEH